MDLFVGRGFANVTLRNIAAEIGYSAGTIYRYFPRGKEEIFFALRGEGFALFHEAQTAARRSRQPAVRLRQHAEAYVRFALANPRYYELMFMTRAPVERALQRAEWAATARSFDLLREDVAAAVAGGMVAADDAESAVFAFWSLLHGVVALQLRGRLGLHSQRSPADLALRAVDLVLGAMERAAGGPKGRGGQAARPAGGSPGF